jgi:circadian clock protein KaiB
MTQGSDSETPAAPASGGEPTLFRLYVADETAASLQALSNLNAIGIDYLGGQYEIEMIDILHEPLRALSDGIMVTPTLIKVSPLPIRRIDGDLHDTQAVLHTLGLTGGDKNGRG